MSVRPHKEKQSIYSAAMLQFSEMKKKKIHPHIAPKVIHPISCTDKQAPKFLAGCFDTDKEKISFRLKC